MCLHVNANLMYRQQHDPKSKKGEKGQDCARTNRMWVYSRRGFPLSGLALLGCSAWGCHRKEGALCRGAQQNPAFVAPTEKFRVLARLIPAVKNI